MKWRLIRIIVLCTMTVFQVGAVRAIDTKDTKMLSQPAIGGNHIAFVYAGDIWIVDAGGGQARRITSDEGTESNPLFSPDGRWIAFEGEYDGNTDVYIVPVEGGIPARLTWHPYGDHVCDFTPDGSAVLFRSGRNVFTNRYTQLFTVSTRGGFPEALDLPRAYKASYSPDGRRLAYMPLSERFRQWKNYRGGTVTTIKLYTLSDHSVETIPQSEGRCNDTDPMWIGGKIYFLSDRNGEFNLFSFDHDTKSVTQLTFFEDFPILDASEGRGRIVFEQAAQLHVYSIETGQMKRLKIGVAGDLQELRPRYVSNARFIRSADVSPSGARAVFEYRGEIVSVPAEKGDPRILTGTTAVHERNPVWSPDGKSIAYFSDASGEYAVHVAPQDGKGDTKKFKLKGTGFYNDLTWSPDSKKLVFEDNGRNLYWIDTENGKTKKIDTQQNYVIGPFGGLDPVWSHDSKWIAYTLCNAALMQQVYLYSIEQDRVNAIADGLSDVGNPAFDASGKYLYVFGSTDAGPVRQWFAMSNADMAMTRHIYLITLRKDIPSPLAKESDEEKPEEDKKEEKKEEKTENEQPFSIDFDGIGHRILSIPVDAGNYYGLRAGEEGKIYYLKAPIRRGAADSDTKLMMYDLKKREETEILAKADDYALTANGKKILVRAGRSWSIIDAGSEAKPGKGKLKTEDIQVRIDPAAEWRQIFDEAWRVNRDYFYARNFHGADWKAMKKKYEAFLPHLACRDDLNRVIRWMCSELSVGHHRVRGGDFLQSPERVPGGLLGADYAIENGRYRFKKVYGGLNWNPSLRSPLTEPGVDVKAGEYLLAVGGVDLKPPTNLYSLFENTAEKIVEITVGPNPGMTDSRTVQVVPIRNESGLRNRDWVEGNLRKVDAATGGRVAYVYVPNTTTMGHTYFKRYFFPQVHKDAVIVDERFNGGGQIADYYIDLLRRPFIAYWHMGYGDDFKTPGGSIQGPKVMLIDETAGSGGDLLPYMFRKFKLGKLIGKRTWGGLVGTLGFPVLMDGAYVTAPNVAIWDEDGWVVENVGVPPDIEVDQTPADVIAGRDPQLEKAIEVILDALAKKPPVKLKRPPYPVRVRK